MHRICAAGDSPEDRDREERGQENDEGEREREREKRVGALLMASRALRLLCAKEGCQ